MMEMMGKVDRVQVENGCRVLILETTEVFLYFVLMWQVTVLHLAHFMSAKEGVSSIPNVLHSVSLCSSSNHTTGRPADRPSLQGGVEMLSF